MAVTQGLREQVKLDLLVRSVLQAAKEIRVTREIPELRAQDQPA